MSGTVPSALSETNAIRRKIIGAVYIHQRANKFFQYLTSTFSSSYFVLTGCGVASLSLNLFRLSQIILLTEQKESIIPYMVFILSHFYYMFICNYMGQKIIDHSTEISVKT
ncbi:uncharacterized protein LOC116845921 [Odontomachus brunneus]|uniref:uncharacterized protein LOC116845921 n=1 Tax=Odontomachus brunneus TaxID=486640 RepID=UPI0013F1C7D2|nr:uncharacterized protein LOC116845921 [Odontomachus brunneus]